MIKNASNTQVASVQGVKAMSTAIQSAKEKLKTFIQSKGLKGIEGIGISYLGDRKPILVVGILKQSFNKNAKIIPPSIDGFKIELELTAKVVLL